MEVRRKAMSIVLSMTSSRNIEEVVLFLKKQLLKTQEADFEKVRNVYAFDVSNTKDIRRHRNTDSCSSSQSMSWQSSSQKSLQASCTL
jgi:hypothetical protein